MAPPTSNKGKGVSKDGSNKSPRKIISKVPGNRRKGSSKSSSKSPKAKPKSKRDNKIQCRCLLTYFADQMKSLHPLTESQKELIGKTPFAEFVNKPSVPGTYTRVGFLLDHYHPKTDTFKFGDIEVPFNSKEFSIVFGLHHEGHRVDPEMKRVTRMRNLYFSGKTGLVTRFNIFAKLRELKDREDDDGVHNFVRMYILFVFSCLLFPTSSWKLPDGLISYVDDLEDVRNFCWGRAVHRFLVLGMVRYIQKDVKKFVDGCSMGLMAWFYEHFPMIGSLKDIRSFPRMFKWNGSKLPNTDKAASKKLRTLKL